jgi:hypothetical protein
MPNGQVSARHLIPVIRATGTCTDRRAPQGPSGLHPAGSHQQPAGPKLSAPNREEPRRWPVRRRVAVVLRDLAHRTRSPGVIQPVPGRFLEPETHDGRNGTARHLVGQLPPPVDRVNIFRPPGSPSASHGSSARLPQQQVTCRLLGSARARIAGLVAVGLGADGAIPYLVELRRRADPNASWSAPGTSATAVNVGALGVGPLAAGCLGARSTWPSRPPASSCATSTRSLWCCSGPTITTASPRADPTGRRPESARIESPAGPPSRLPQGPVTTPPTQKAISASR